MYVFLKIFPIRCSYAIYHELVILKKLNIPLTSFNMNLLKRNKIMF